ncbi:hypothetical protein GQ43DRAFT_426080 [Delitschia confertaspora ATCC 74209]|uniref:Coupling of ubiquitin conjugation to ER degradation protein 1 n=1 Tax=Delitschia confertaspora ATCC 74209 TaxID=1513339 RepID=A0A9P4MR65_9PLEO|nr:hypothetical protein GQ43DRAFT_426080 [Delitschia confertaspora ATCC 74209]
MAEQTLNIPQTVVFVLVVFLIVRWYYAKPSNAARLPPGQNRGFQVDPTQVDQIAQMFPQLGRREIMWDLQRNGGNVSATTERILSGRGLENPPPSFQPQTLRSAPAATAPRTATRTENKPAHPDLITRYNLSSKLHAAAEASTSGSEAPKKIWSQDRDERQRNLQRRREEMILTARRRLEEKEKTKDTGVSA